MQGDVEGVAAEGESAAVGRDPPAIGQMMAVTDHGDARSAVSIGFDHPRIYNLAVRSGT